MDASLPERLTESELRQLDAICDRFEQALRAQTQADPVAYLNACMDPAMRRWLQCELELIAKQFRLALSDDGVAEQPDELLVLAVCNGPRKGRRIPIARNRSLVIGRDEAVDVRITGDPFVSKQHCRLVASQDAVYLFDLDSRNGTLLNGRIVAEACLQVGDVVAVGETQLKIVAPHET